MKPAANAGGCNDHVEAIKTAKPKMGRPAKPEESSDNVRTLPTTSKTGGNSREYLLQRLADFDAENGTDWWNQVMSNKMSARRAAIEAGIIKDSHAPLPRLKQYWKKATEEDREEFRRWLRTKEAK